MDIFGSTIQNPHSTYTEHVLRFVEHECKLNEVNVLVHKKYLGIYTFYDADTGFTIMSADFGCGNDLVKINSRIIIDATTGSVCEDQSASAKIKWIFYPPGTNDEHNESAFKQFELDMQTIIRAIYIIHALQPVCKIK